MTQLIRILFSLVFLNLLSQILYAQYDYKKNFYSQYFNLKDCVQIDTLIEKTNSVDSSTRVELQLSPLDIPIKINVTIKGNDTLCTLSDLLKVGFLVDLCPELCSMEGVDRTEMINQIRGLKRFKFLDTLQNKGVGYDKLVGSGKSTFELQFSLRVVRQRGTDSFDEYQIIPISRFSSVYDEYDGSLVLLLELKCIAVGKHYRFRQYRHVYFKPDTYEIVLDDVESEWNYYEIPGLPD